MLNRFYRRIFPFGIHSLSMHLMVVAIGFVLVPSAIIMGFYIADEYAHSKKEQLSRLQTNLVLRQQSVEDWFEERRLDIQRLAQSPAARTGHKGNLEQLLHLFLNEQRDHNALVYINKQGISEIDTGGPAGLNLADREYFRAGQRGEFFITGVLTGRQSGQPIVILSSPVYDEQDEFQGVVFGSVRLDKLAVLIGEVNSSGVDEWSLIDAAGQVIIPSHLRNAS